MLIGVLIAEELAGLGGVVIGPGLVGFEISSGLLGWRPYH